MGSQKIWEMHVSYVDGSAIGTYSYGTDIMEKHKQCLRVRVVWSFIFEACVSYMPTLHSLGNAYKRLNHTKAVLFSGPVCPAIWKDLSHISVPSTTVDYWGPCSQQAVACCTIVSLIGGMSEVASLSKDRKQSLVGLGGVTRWKKLREERESEMEGKRDWFVLIRSGCAHLPQVTSKLVDRGVTSFIYMCEYVFEYECVYGHVSPRVSGKMCCVWTGQWNYKVWVQSFLISCSHYSSSSGKARMKTVGTERQRNGAEGESVRERPKLKWQYN